MQPDIYFDLDGTLTDPLEGIGESIQYALEKMGVPRVDDASLRACIGPPLLATFEQLINAESTHQAIAYYRERFGDVGWRENIVYPEIPGTLQALRDSGFRLFVATSKPTVFAERIVEHFELAQFFTAVHGSELDGTRTNKVELLSYALERNDSQTAVMIGDRSHDAIGAIDNGMPFIGVLYGYGSREEFEAAGASQWVERPSELPATIRALNEPGENGPKTGKPQ